MPKPRGLTTFWAGDIGPGPPPERRPREPREAAQAPRDRLPGTHALVLNKKIKRTQKNSIFYRI